MESGEKFWTGAKRFPRAADLGMSEEQHAAFVLATANLLAAGCGLSPQEEGLLPLGHPQRDVEGIFVFYIFMFLHFWRFGWLGREGGRGVFFLFSFQFRARCLVLIGILRTYLVIV